MASDEKFCERHRKKKVELEPDKPNATEMGYGNDWKKFSKWYREMHPFCARCGRPVAMVHHVVPLKAGGAHCVEENSVGLCWKCHFKEHPKGRR